jgi:glyoxylase I family protein
MNDLQGFHHVAVTIRDLDTSVGWYRDLLGFQELFSEDAPDRRACVMKFPGGSYGVGLVEYPIVPWAPFDPRHSGLDHLAFTVATLDAIRDWATKLSDAGIEHSGVIDLPSGAILNFKDPDGIALALFWERPR